MLYQPIEEKMNNSEIASVLEEFAKLSELHEGNPFKIKALAAAAFQLDKNPVQLAGLSLEEIGKVQGIGKSLAQTIYTLIQQNSLPELEQLIAETPEGIREIMQIKGIGPKKVRLIWKNLGIENMGELLYACKENRLLHLKGFGEKTQNNVLQQIYFKMENADKFHYARLENLAMQLVTQLSAYSSKISLTGDIRRACEVLENIELVMAIDNNSMPTLSIEGLQINHETNETINGTYFQIPIVVHKTSIQQFYQKLFDTTGSAIHQTAYPKIDSTAQCFESEEAIYKSMNMAFIPAELRESAEIIAKAQSHTLPELIQLKDLKGPLHNHSIWSDGQNSIEEMALWCMQKGYAYLGMADHSKSAFYANGLSIERVFAQHAEIDSLNLKFPNFKILKGIESDILNDGSLDYPDEVLATFDYVVASVHSNLKMTEEKAMSRLIKAIENPYTHILGHPTGRLLLMRAGYPIDHKKIIDACAANGVHIEINANPYRLDLDWRHIDYAIQKGVLLSINPDAHELAGFNDMHFGILAARKGGLTKLACLNALSDEALKLKFHKN
jgi:DNA polymerase (family 10)